ncbi:cytochrome P450 [Daedaleopsis nitida]|nr:cytochrome P450 [Daedaleopsis nitida]
MDFNRSCLLSILFVPLLLYLWSILRWRARARGLPLPPGPIPLPIVGNILNAPRVRPWVAYRNMNSNSDGLVHVQIMGQSIVVLNNADVIDEYLDKRSAITSDRKQSHMVELTGSQLNLGFHPYGTWWRRHKRVFWQYFMPSAVKDYASIQRTTARKFLKLLLDDPSCFQQHIRYTFLAAMLKLLYDIDAAEKEDKYIGIIDTAQEGVSQGLVPGRFLVEFFPILRYVPAWVPGAGYQKMFAKWQAAGHALKTLPFCALKAAMSRGQSLHCVIARQLATLDDSGIKGDALKEEEDIVQNVGAVAFEAGSDTTFSTLQTVFLAMSLHPECLKKAHAELDKVVGPSRLPDFSDRDGLVYVDAIIKEALRWHNVVPLGVPHCSTVDDEYRGYFIPKGTVLMPNIWQRGGANSSNRACMHDPDVYKDPDEFRPERFIKDGRLDATVRDPSKFVFGFGRRICPGRYFADAALFINVASVLHVFDITAPLDENGQTIKINPGMTDGLLSYPEDVRCQTKPRSAQAKRLIMIST